MEQKSTSGFNFRRLSFTTIIAFLTALGISPASSQTWTIGTGTTMYSSTGTPVSPLGYFYPQVRVNYLYDTASMSAAGMPVGGGTIPIHQIAFNVGTLNSAMKAKNFQIGIGGTTVSALPTTGFLSGTGGYPIYYSAPVGYQPSPGWNTITLTTPFFWNGTDNINIELCWTDGTTSTSNQAGVYYHTTSSGVKSTYFGGTGTAPYCNSPGGPTTGNTTNRPNIRFTRLFPCTGPSTVPTTTPSGTANAICPGFSSTIVSSGYTPALNSRFQWWTSATPTGPWSHASGDSSGDKYTTPPLIANTYYRLVITCMNTGDSVVSAVVGFTPTGGFPVYASLPYFESFESWGNGCATNDKVSSNNWTNIPITGDASWRREDQGASASWYNPTAYAPAKAIDGLHSARHNSYVANIANTEGNLSLYFNASATTGNKDVSFYYRFNYGSSSVNYDSLNVELSTDGGLTFTSIAKYGNASQPYQTWIFAKFNIATTSATNVLRFRSRPLITTHDDVYIDAVRIDPPCTGKPEAGIVDTTILACNNKAFRLGLLGNDHTAGLAYLWQSRKPGTSAWSPVAGGNVENPTVTITSPTEFRCIVTCTYSTPNMSDTTPVHLMNLAPFYYCYCDAGVNPTYAGYGYAEVGNVSMFTQPALVNILNNGNASPSLSNPTASFTGYQDYRRSVAPPTIIRDSTYRIAISQISGNNTWAGSNGVAFIDFNRDGIFQNSEMVINRSIASSGSPTVQTNFTVPGTAPAGLTGMRIIVIYSPPSPVSPCGNTPYYGQVEDYLVRLEYNPCTGPVDPGFAWISDTAVCRGYTVDLYDTSYEHTRTDISRMWEVSTNGGASFAAIPGSAQKDTMKNVVVTAASAYRLRVICDKTSDTTYSNIVYVTTPDPVRCYPTSWAFPGGSDDSSDIGAVILGESLINPPAGTPSGPHLLNPSAHRRRSDFTLMTPTELNADSIYRIAVFHMMPGAYHADALISVFMDFNNDGDYDLSVPPPPFTSELIFQGVSVWDSFFLDTKIKIPSAVIPNVPTGMRVVLNNDINPYGSGNTGSGNFVSGEVEDYVVIFRRTPLSVPGASLMQNVALFPNPTNGKVSIVSDAIRPISHLDIVVTTMTGQQVLVKSFDQPGTRFSTSIDLSAEAKGVYFVELRADGERITRKLVLR